MRTRIFPIILTCCALAVGIVAAQDRSGRGGPDRGGSSAPSGRGDNRAPLKWWTIDKYKQELKLTADQSARIEKVFQASMEQLRADKDALDRARATFSALMERPTAGDLEFSRAVEGLELARYNVSKEQTFMLVRIHIILTPDQRKGLDAIRKRNEADKNRPH
jgi:Spy/CpxP family protein refolding chaperone